MSRLSAASEPEPSGLPRMAMSPEPPMPLQLFVPPDMTLLRCAEVMPSTALYFLCSTINILNEKYRFPITTNNGFVFARSFELS